mmetsp:Transcript_892/g.1488  ORF Transcript_892/g.1488 Transcript_892/m.1488 type:complete len:305 (-) Transcript_892:2046-2960(-)
MFVFNGILSKKTIPIENCLNEKRNYHEKTSSLFIYSTKKVKKTILNIKRGIIHSVVHKKNIFLLKSRISGFLNAKKKQNNLKYLLRGNFINSSQKDSDQSINYKFKDYHHLQIVCNIELISNFVATNSILKANYYFPIKNTTTFRLRVYYLGISEFSCKRNPIVKMDIVRNDPILSSSLKSESESDRLEKPLNKTKKEIMSNCSVNWVFSSKPGGIRTDEIVFYGFIPRGGCSVYSERVLEFIHINDSLKLAPHLLWVNDRAFFNGGELIYGNLNNISFHLDRLLACDFLEWVKIKKNKMSGTI